MYTIIRQKIRKLVLDILSINSHPKPGVHILNGHILSLDNNQSSDIFSNLISKLLKNGVVLLDFDEAVSRIANKQIETEKCYVSFTFDDGFEECYTKIAPVLNKFKTKACFFINPGFVDGDEGYRKNFLNNVVYTNSDKKSMSWDQIKELKNQGHTIGSHTMDHCRLNGLDKNYTYQIQEAKKVIENKLQVPCEYFAYTYGKINDFSLDALKIVQNYHSYIFSQDDYQHYFSFGGIVINRRHFECNWNPRHVMYFLKHKEL